MMVMFFQQWSGINALIYYGPLLMQSLGFTGNKINLLVSGGVNIVQFIAVFPAILYIDRCGRKPLLRGGSAFMGISHMVISLLGGICVHSSIWRELRADFMDPSYLKLAEQLYDPITFSVRHDSELTINWSVLIGLVTPALMERSPAGTFGIFACACFAAYLWSTYIVPETANVSLEEIDSVFRSSAGREDIQVKKEIERNLGLNDLIRGVVREQEQ
ncbi:hypothetical protein EWM64_g385 [Hericium alpestre]|uniref:Major facilitator superfamily (MFS) profile domain-containing protein n=1 Tax=Hericium alpestre TaxID=135208 RepID=A0A4Z0A9A3_9AGAM|nr:hypothetical protein EWM64_g385 [Hericium alpestre]